MEAGSIPQLIADSGGEIAGYQEANRGRASEDSVDPIDGHHGVIDRERILCGTDLADERRNLLECAFQDEQLHTVVVTHVVVNVGGHEVFVFVAKMHHLVFDVRGLEIKQHRHDTHQIPVFEFLVVELGQEVPCRLPDDFATPGIAVFIRESIESFE